MIKNGQYGEAENEMTWLGDVTRLRYHKCVFSCHWLHRLHADRNAKAKVVQ
jgi:hypothetical protein